MLIAGAICAIGLVVFCLNLPRPWLALAVAVPYLVIVVCMGYTRQGVALGLAMLGLVALGKKGIGWFVFWVMLAAMFHKTAVLLLPLAALAAAHNRFVAMAWGVGSLDWATGCSSRIPWTAFIRITSRLNISRQAR